ncbi:glycosyltransferase [Thermocrinis sp.]
MFFKRELLDKPVYNQSMRVAFLKVGEYEGLARHIKAFIRRFREKGAEVLELNLAEGDINEKVKELMDFSPIFCIDLNANGVITVSQEDKKTALSDALGFVHVSIFTDEPMFNFLPILDISSATNFLPVVCDLKYADSLAFMGIKQPPFYITPFIDLEQMGKPEAERDINLAFFEPVIDPNIIANSVAQNLRQEFLGVFFEVGDFMFRNPEVHILQAHDYILSMFNPSLQEEYNKWREENPQDFYALLNQISLYATAKKRWFLLSFLDGMELKVFGEVQGEPFDGHQSIVPQSLSELLELLGRTSLVITSYPHSVPTGVGFVPLEVAGMGCAMMVDYRATLPGFFQPEEEVITYLPLDRAEIEEKVMYYMDNPDKALEIGQKAQKKVFEKYTHEDRADFLYDLFSNILASSQKS